jgi:hypothetical protein
MDLRRMKSDKRPTREATDKRQATDKRSDRQEKRPTREATDKRQIKLNPYVLDIFY